MQKAKGGENTSHMADGKTSKKPTKREVWGN
jgi:hypothetical protein